MSKQPSSAFLYLRSVARRPSVRRFAEPAAARYYAFRNRGLDQHALWESGAIFESSHWDHEWLAVARADGLLDADSALDDSFVAPIIDEMPDTGDPVRLLDVGAGPLTPLGKVHPRRDVRIVPCDALADSYDALLERVGITAPIRTVFAEGEHLIRTFGVDEFDIVHCSNALDHHYDPMSALEQMMAVASPQGVVLLNHYEDEGEYRRYMGMHQWNITERCGHLRIWNRKADYDVNQLFAGWATVKCFRRTFADDDRQRVYAVLQRIA